MLAGAWERLEQGRADIVVAPDMHFRSSSEINSRKLYSVMSVYVAAPDHPIHQELAGLGVATMPYPLVEQDIAEGRLRVVSPEYSNEIDIIMAWRRDSMGEAKSWCLREIPKLFMVR